MLTSFAAGAYVRFRAEVSVPVEKIKDTISIDMGKKLTGSLNILLLGEDNVEGSRRTDSIALAFVDLDAKTVKVISLPRDTRVNIPGHGFQKLNHSYAFGGVDLLKSTIMSNLGVPIHYYVLLDYGSFARMIDSIGGVDVYVPKRMRYVDRAGGLNINLERGFQHLDGERSLHFVRFRHDAMGDIGRVQRQQEFIKAVLNKLKSPEMVTKVPQFVKEAVSIIKTDMPLSAALQLGGFLSEIDKGSVLFTMLPGKPSYIKGVSYWLPEMEGFRRICAMSITELSSPNTASQDVGATYGVPISTASDRDVYEDKGTKTQVSVNEGLEGADFKGLVKSITVPVAILNGTGKKGLGQIASETFQKMGVEVIYTGNAKHFDYRASLVLYPDGANQDTIRAAKSMAKLCGIRDSMVRSGRQAMFASLVLGGDYKEILENLNEARKYLDSQ
ncbi:MAG: LCP family protein [Thermanaerothrix sp.]|nr:LCP family protein [Thermanaerothrix sp.]